MVVHPQVARVAVVVHPTRSIAEPLGALERWAESHDRPLVQPPAVGRWSREVAPSAELVPGDLVVALGGDGTVLSALRASAQAGAPVLGVACGSVSALTAVPADRIVDALDRVVAGDWTERRLPALAIAPADSPGQWAINDFVAVRHGGGQVTVEVSVDGELYTRLAGDGVVVATPLGSTAYSMAAGGPVLVAGTPGFVCTPVSMHGGNAPPLVVPVGSSVRLEVQPGFAGFDIEIDGHVQPLSASEYRVTLHHDKVVLVSFGEPGLGMAGLRARRIIVDSPRVLARDDRTPRD